jgi:hypothetical protein
MIKSSEYAMKDIDWIVNIGGDSGEFPGYQNRNATARPVRPFVATGLKETARSGFSRR